MAIRENTFLLKRSNVPGKVPLPGDVQLGEVALNTADVKLYASGTTENDIVQIGWDRISRTGDTVTGDFVFNGDLSATTISATTYLNLPMIGGGGDYLPLSGGTVTGDTVFTSGLTVNSVDFNTGSTVTGNVGRLVWNDADGTLDLGLKGGNVTLQIGQEQVVRVVNKSGSNLLESQYRVVRIRRVDEGGSQGQRLAVVLAQANNDANSVDTLGIVTENIDNNQEGFITTSGLVNGINTTGSLQGETWLDGDLLYLSPTTPGFLTKVKPIAPQHTIVMGYVVYAHNNNGKIFVKVDNGYELDELHNVRISGETNGDLLQYNSTLSVWENSKTLNGNYNVVGVLSATTISATTYQNLPSILLDSHIGGSNTDNIQFSRLRNILIPANTLSDGDVIQVSILTLQNFTSVNKNCSLHLTPSIATTLTTSNRIAASVQGTTATIQHPILREFIYWQGALQLLQTSATGAGDDPRTSGTISTEELYTFNNAIDNYFVIAAGSAANNTFTKELKRSIIKIIKK